MKAARVGSLFAVVAVFNLFTSEKALAQQVTHMSVEGSLYEEAMNERRRLNEKFNEYAFEEEEVGHEVANEMLVAQDQLKKATSTTMLESYTQGQAVDQTKAVLLDEDAEHDADQGETSEPVEDTVVKAVPLDENGQPISADNLNP